MIISREVSGVSPLFTLERDGSTVVATLSYGLTGYFDEELGYDIWSGELISNIGDDVGYLYQDADRPMDVQYSATLDDGVSEDGYLEINDYIGGALIILDFAVTAFSSAGVLTGSEVADFAFGSDFADRMNGGDGDDRLEGAAGRDRLQGDAGDDDLRGDADADWLSGVDGDDNLRGGRGADTLAGDAGEDRLAGGRGADAFLFSAPLDAAGIDVVVGFEVGRDVILLDDAVFDAVGGPGGLTPAQFAASADGVATDGAQRILYAAGSGALFYDADGSGEGGAVQIARLKPGLALTEADFAVV